MNVADRAAFLARLESDEPFTEAERAHAAAELAKDRAARQAVLTLPPPESKIT